MQRRNLILAALTCLFSLVATPATAQIIDTPASHAVIMDYTTGEILFSKNGDEPMIPASMTKMMTAYLVFDMINRGEISLTDRLTVSEDAWRRGGFPSGTSTMGLVPKDTPTVEELLHGVIIMSGNDACIVLGEGLAGSEEAFAKRMTDLAHEKGLKSVNFLNATGLEAVGHVISAADLARLAKMTIEDYPQYYEWYDDPSYSWREYTQPNRNPLLEVAGADGLKTGHLEAAGYGLTASAVRDGVRRIIVINGLPTKAARASEGERMMRLAFQSYELKTIAPESVALPEQKVWLGQQGLVPVSLAEPMLIAGHKAAFEKAKTEIVLEKPLEAPIKKGDRVGKLVVTLEGRPPVEAPVIAEADVKKLGFFGRAVEGLSAMISGNDG
ncbi:D-alanyl-D-alanine carboxypeptidase family protein [Hyphomonas johnsonii]|jgi:D-alanyl-D-alanine carboxypeptidase (penicillin-binding protein 5/6)|uniref:serine-type D-Ala-D-Ala carboxypeptidase n=1 Tax=Hyphomonas johnsonii MHS-2 TaxID=1280950 RepID=A0A059FW67_9PROT|nr:D-alanyl-D-alanine carboxypeptidase family protein [Hyphomonas johnsonii]KCZ94688.1 D-alanyl-D-alanine carboxypeptidase [Hyphomonas johnsonii MHS-2]